MARDRGKVLAERELKRKTDKGMDEERERETDKKQSVVCVTNGIYNGEINLPPKIH